MTTRQRSQYANPDYRKARVKVLARDGYICAYCGQEATTVDHVVPLSKGGSATDLENLVACCSRCNSMKRDKSQAFFLAQSVTPPVSQRVISPLTLATTPSAPIATINE